MPDIPFEVFWTFFADTWTFIFVQSKSSITVLVVVHVIMIRFIYLSFKPSHRNKLSKKRDRLEDVVFKGPSWAKVKRFGIFCRLYLWLDVIILTTLILVVNFYASDLCERWAMKFDGTKFGILICRFNGPDLREYYGDLGIAQKIDNEIRTNVLASLNEEIEVKFSNRSFRDFAEAGVWGEKQGARLSIWGGIETSTDSIYVQMAFSGFDPLQVEPSYGPGKYTIDMPRLFGFGIAKNSIGPNKPISNLVKNLALHSLLNVSLADQDWGSALEYIEKIKPVFVTWPTTNCFTYSLLEAYCYIQEKNWSQCLNSLEVSDSCLTRIGDFEGSMKTAILDMRARALINLGDTTSALATLKKAYSLHENNFGPMYGLAEIYLKMGEFDSSFFYANEGLKLDSLNAEMNLYAGSALIMLQRGKESIPYLQRSNRTNADDELALRLLTAMYAQYFPPESTIALIDRSELPVGNPFNFYQFRKLIAFMILNRIEVASQLIKSSANDRPCLAIGYIMLANSSLQKGDTTEARSFWRQFKESGLENINECCLYLQCDPSDVRRDIKELEKILSTTGVK